MEEFSFKVSDMFFQGKLYWTYLRNRLVWLMWKEKEVHRLDTEWTMWPWPLTSPITLTFDFSRSHFKIAVSQELLSDWCETKIYKSVRYWADCMVLTFDHTHDLDLVLSRSKFLITLFQEWVCFLILRARTISYPTIPDRDLRICNLAISYSTVSVHFIDARDIVMLLQRQIQSANVSMILNLGDRAAAAKYIAIDMDRICITPKVWQHLSSL